MQLIIMIRHRFELSTGVKTLSQYFQGKHLMVAYLNKWREYGFFPVSSSMRYTGIT